MTKLESKLPAFALPFVTRSLRRGLARRYALFSLLLAGLVLLTGLWAALGSGEAERELRQGVGLEQPTWERERQAFTVLATDEYGYDYNRGQLDKLHRGEVADEYSDVLRVRQEGLQALAGAMHSPELDDPEQRALQARAQALLNRELPEAERAYLSGRWVDWSDPADVEMIEAIVAREAMPSVERYRSPLGLRHALLFAGAIAGAILLLLGTVIAPLLVAVQQAQERHENTLMPLTGTSLSPRQLVLGLASGPLAVTALFAGPQIVLFALGTAVGGRPGIAAVMLATLAATSFLLVFGAQLLGHMVGKRRTPGVVGIALMSLAGAAWFAGAVLAVEIDTEIIGFTALLPHMGLSTLMGLSFDPVGLSVPRHLWVGTLGNALGGLVIGWLALTALSRTIAGREGPLLTRLEGALGALTCIVLANLALPLDMGSEAGAIRHFVGLAILALPLALLLAGRVPQGDGPARLRRVPVPSLLLEFGLWALAHVVVAAMLASFFDDESIMMFAHDRATHVFHPVSLLWMGWCVGVLGLIVVRLVALPNRLAAHIWTAFCAMSLIAGFVQSMFWGLDSHLDAADVFAMFELSAVLGLLQLGLTIWIPVSMLRSLRKGLHKVA